MRLFDLIDGTEYRVLRGSVDVEVHEIRYDSRQVRPGDLFVCISGFRRDGHDFIQAAWAAGAAAVLIERNDLPEAWLQGGAVVKVANARQGLAAAACRFYGHPSRRLTMVGVTGTNGKTTTTHLVESVLRRAGHQVGLIGTIGYRCNGVEIEAARTTPESYDLQALLQRMALQHADSVVMEVSSHALALHRVDGCEFDVAVFTNLTQDHLDFHSTMEAYRNAKLSLFEELGVGSTKTREKAAVVNLDDPAADCFLRATKVRHLTYSVERPADLSATDIDMGPDGVRCRLQTPWGATTIRSPLLGRYNLSNILAAAATGLHLGADLSMVADGIAALRHVSGRCERIEAGQEFNVMVDYAHTPDALRRVLRMARQCCPGRLIVLFGCGGERDRGKRPIMGEAALELADFTVITSDNPRGEDPHQIIEEVEAGAKKVWGQGKGYVTILDRGMAIREALSLAGRGDMVVIAGKGHETYQILRDRTISFDDRLVAREALHELGFHEKTGSRV
ncbi:UDP-N-acetylmuramoylalanyl-D-glutamate 2, 6-diaminopimelate ligase (UDP-N-acetylmuramyl-tripeptide synthetase) [Candidatus Methylomirabilis lanthanidiphila]|uniref:UDP-N-acetylmuramoyl-L-alanyl-D-glutamate--2,6-diaminopimelate ligase n=1 Tax=Candidatus Methylomirabilis lanthanidiphila TaxID=2211376 RepID=A0A564ZFN8_9BACT|nr:UDP-N-acetylmuramoyl-L-alanyl-D-glutamate--2,6-diaminopimelate ligase [Candidatus Methylomirabilis lanthanidiphila]VUZ84161.1 UDP-N-acetylmuramoylalanyl-D-glutamate 2, 6-diaminopimelate ligase (UDP-N-acetylmuramyl-tripeptide synthetase) [Candidatus Methylomirabilis lanthanidiphila]